MQGGKVVPNPAASGGLGQPPNPGGFLFEYTGKTAITLIGNVTGRVYRFAAPGATAVVDPRDRAGMSRVPQLRVVALPASR